MTHIVDKTIEIVIFRPKLSEKKGGDNFLQIFYVDTLAYCLHIVFDHFTPVASSVCVTAPNIKLMGDTFVVEGITNIFCIF